MNELINYRWINQSVFFICGRKIQSNIEWINSHWLCVFVCVCFKEIFSIWWCGILFPRNQNQNHHRQHQYQHRSFTDIMLNVLIYGDRDIKTHRHITPIYIFTNIRCHWMRPPMFFVGLVCHCMMMIIIIIIIIELSPSEIQIIFYCFKTDNLIMMM